jgi:hypothetical protein
MHLMRFLLRPYLFLGTYFSLSFENLKFKLCFCDGVSILPFKGWIALPIRNPTMRLFYATHELSNEPSFVSGDVFFMEMSKFEVQNSFLSCYFVMAGFFHHGEAKSLYESKIRQCGCFMHLTSFLMRPHSSLGTYFSWRCQNLKFKIHFCHVILSWRVSFIMERPSRFTNWKSDNTALLCIQQAF